MQVQLENPITQRIFRCKKSRNGKTIFDKKRVGFMVAGINPETKELSIGFTLCHKKDRYDFVPKTIDAEDQSKMHLKGYGKMYAAERAVQWNDATMVDVPPSIRPQISKFIFRCFKYYKDKALPHWTVMYRS